MKFELQKRKKLNKVISEKNKKWNSPVPTCFCCIELVSFGGKTCTCLCPGTIVAVGIDGWFVDERIELIGVDVEEDN